LVDRQSRPSILIPLSAPIVDVLFGPEEQHRFSGEDNVVPPAFRRHGKMDHAARRHNLAVTDLLEGADDFKTDNSVTFLRLRNQIAHGNLDGIIDLAREGFALDYSRKAAKLALAHLNKADQFILEWFNTAPDVQQRRICRGLWPT
jgi:hypothetical protein